MKIDNQCGRNCEFLCEPLWKVRSYKKQTGLKYQRRVGNGGGEVSQNYVVCIHTTYHHSHLSDQISYALEAGFKRIYVFRYHGGGKFSGSAISSLSEITG